MTAPAVSAHVTTRHPDCDTVQADVRNHIGHLTLNRPDALNVIDLGRVRLLRAQLDAWASDDKVCAVVLRSSGEKAFCAGGDIRAIYNSFNNDDTVHDEFCAEEYALDLTLHHCRKPVMALIIEQLREVTVVDSHQWAVSVADLMETRSPLAMAVTLELLRRGRHLSLQAYFALELQLDRQWFERGNLIEGVRALIIDKDKKPHWKPAHVQALDAGHIARVFSGHEA